MKDIEKWGFREPVNGFLHLLGLVLSVVGTAAMVWRFWAEPERAAIAAFYGLTMAGCFLASTLHHLVRSTPETEFKLLRIDQSAIFSFIAGSYTPICLYMVPGWPGRVMLAVVWAIAVMGIVYRMFFAPDPERVEDPPKLRVTLMYIAMSLLAMFQISELAAHSLSGTLALAGAGGAAYIVGGFILSGKLFDFWPGRLGHHEIWHACVLVGSACMYGFIFLNLGAN